MCEAEFSGKSYHSALIFCDSLLIEKGDVTLLITEGEITSGVTTKHVKHDIFVAWRRNPRIQGSLSGVWKKKQKLEWKFLGVNHREHINDNMMTLRRANHVSKTCEARRRV